jgi:hypothetical protein
MYINDGDRPRMGATRSATYVSVTYKAPASSDCSVYLRTHFGDQREACLEVFGPLPGSGDRSSGTAWRRCNRLPGQAWIVKYHWRNQHGLVYYRIHSSRDEGLCLQQAWKGGVGAPYLFRPAAASVRFAGL